jgi:hypothetical protein
MQKSRCSIGRIKYRANHRRETEKEKGKEKKKPGCTQRMLRLARTLDREASSEISAKSKSRSQSHTPLSLSKILAPPNGFSSAQPVGRGHAQHHTNVTPACICVLAKSAVESSLQESFPRLTLPAAGIMEQSTDFACVREVARRCYCVAAIAATAACPIFGTAAELSWPCPHLQQVFLNGLVSSDEDRPS